MTRLRLAGSWLRASGFRPCLGGGRKGFKPTARRSYLTDRSVLRSRGTLHTIVRLSLLTLALGCVLAHAPTLDAQPQPATRIVSLVPAVTEMLFAIGAGPQVVGVSSFDREPPEVDRLPRVGALLDPDLERIFALRPDLVVIYGSQDELGRQLERARVPLFPYRHAGLAAIEDTIRGLGERTGRAAEAAALNGRIRADLDLVRQRVAGRPPPRVLLVIGRDPDTLRNVWASGGVGFLHEVLTLAGGVNVLADVEREGLQISSEQMLARGPEVILELRADGGPGSGDDPRVWSALSGLPAVRTGRVHILRGSELVVPGPRIARGAERIARALHPEAW